MKFYEPSPEVAEAMAATVDLPFRCPTCHYRPFGSEHQQVTAMAEHRCFEYGVTA